MMLHRFMDGIRTSRSRSLARAFHRIGSAGFWLQVVVGVLSAILMIYLFVFSHSPSGPRAGVRFVEYLTMASLLVLAFTTFWSHRYTLLARRLAEPQSRPSREAVVGAVWTGLVASSLGVLVSILILLVESAQLLFYFLSTPQVGVPVFQNPGGGAASWVSAADMVSMVCLVLILATEMIVLLSSLWLMFRATQPSPEFPER